MPLKKTWNSAWNAQSSMSKKIHSAFLLKRDSIAVAVFINNGYAQCA